MSESNSSQARAATQVPFAPEVEIFAEGLRFPEGPVALADGALLVVEIRAGCITRIDAGKPEMIARPGGGPNGLALGPNGHVYIANNGGCFEFIDLGGFTVPGGVPEEWEGGSIQRLNLASGEVETMYEACDGRRLRAPNDLVFDAHGGFWFTDHGVRLDRTSDRTGVFYAAADGSEIREVVFPLDAPNGIGLSPGGDRLYVAETHTGRLWAWEVTAPGVVANPTGLHAGGTLMAGRPDLAMFDSLAVDSVGNVVVGTLVQGGLTVVPPQGDSYSHLTLPDPLVTNLCFGGHELQDAYVTMSATGRVGRFAWHVPGLPLN